VPLYPSSVLLDEHIARGGDLPLKLEHLTLNRPFFLLGIGAHACVQNGSLHTLPLIPEPRQGVESGLGTTNSKVNCDQAFALVCGRSLRGIDIGPVRRGAFYRKVRAVLSGRHPKLSQSPFLLVGKVFSRSSAQFTASTPGWIGKAKEWPAAGFPEAWSFLY
jgi:hypothetical protein